jgi:hypothetical protein
MLLAAFDEARHYSFPLSLNCLPFNVSNAEAIPADQSAATTATKYFMVVLAFLTPTAPQLLIFGRADENNERELRCDRFGALT